jgi:CrcB protein
MITTGFIGAFTTFSAFSIETILLLEADKLILALTYVLVSLIGGMTFAFVGLRLAELGNRRRELS